MLSVTILTIFKFSYLIPFAEVFDPAVVQVQSYELLWVETWRQRRERICFPLDPTQVVRQIVEIPRDMDIVNNKQAKPLHSLERFRVEIHLFSLGQDELNSFDLVRPLVPEPTEKLEISVLEEKPLMLK